MTGTALDALNHDILIYIFTALSIPEILLLRQASRRLYLVSEEHAVWKTACANEILGNGIPFPKRPLTSFSAKHLERQTLHAYRLGLNWRSPTTSLHHVVSCPSRVGSIEEIKFLSRRGQNWIVTTSLAIWWTLSVRDCESFQVVAQWSPGKALFNGFAVNANDDSDASIAISVHRDGHAMVEILAISDDDAYEVTIKSIRTLDTSSKPITLNGSIIALCDHDSETLILNWKTEEHAILKSPDTWQDKPLHVVLANGNILVVRARSICIFEEPRMVLPGGELIATPPRMCKSFGWVDGVSLASEHSPTFRPISSSEPPLSLLVRKKGDDPWRPTEQFQFMMMNTDLGSNTSLESSPNEHEAVSFRFDLVSSLSSYHRSPLRCSDMVLGSHGTAVWIQPLDWAAVGLVVDDSFVEDVTATTSHEKLVCALFPGSLNGGSTDAQIKVVLENDGNSWSCLDYDEARGMIALGSSSGEVSVYRL